MREFNNRVEERALRYLEEKRREAEGAAQNAVHEHAPRYRRHRRAARRRTLRRKRPSRRCGSFSTWKMISIWEMGSLLERRNNGRQLIGHSAPDSAAAQDLQCTG